MPPKYIITVIEAKDLKNSDFVGKSDPFLRLKFGKITIKTKHKNDTLTPVWNETFTLEVPQKEGNVMEIEVVDKNDITGDKSMGTATINIEDATQNWYQFVDEKKKKAGMVKLSFKFIDAVEKEVSVETKKEGGFLGFLQEHGWIIYIVCLLGVIVYKFFYKTKSPLSVNKGTAIVTSGDFISSDSHYLALSTTGNLELYEGTSPDTTSTLEWESGTSIGCGTKCTAYLTEDGVIEIRKGKKVKYSVTVSDVTDLSDVVPV